MPSVSPCAPLRSSSRFASCTSAAPARPSSFWAVAVRTLRGLSLPAVAVRAAVRSVQPLTSLIKQIVSPTTHATNVQTAATEKAIATIHSQMFVSFSFILFDYSVAIFPRFQILARSYGPAGGGAAVYPSSLASAYPAIFMPPSGVGGKVKMESSTSRLAAPCARIVWSSWRNFQIQSQRKKWCNSL